MSQVGDALPGIQTLCPHCGAALDPYSGGRCRACGRTPDRLPSPAAVEPESVAYDLSFETPLDRASVSDLLAEAAIPHVWAEAFELRIPASYEEPADRIFDQLAETPDDLTGSGAEDYAEVAPGAASSEVAVEALARLFDAADRLMHRPTSRSAARELSDAGPVVIATPAPDGFGRAWWTQVGQLTQSLLAAVGQVSDDDDEFRETAQHLRDLLRDSV